MKKVILVMLCAGVSAAGAITVAQSTNDAGRDWAYPQADQGASRYSTLTQINTSNVRTLRRAWTFKTGSGRFASAPMVIDGVMYITPPNGVYALDGATGQQIWKFHPGAPEGAAGGRGGRGGRGGGGPEGGRGGGQGRGGAAGLGDQRPDGGEAAFSADPAGTARRGPTYWAGRPGIAPRIYSTTTPGLAALDAKTGTLITSFGDGGYLRNIRPNSPAVIYQDFLIMDGGVEPGKGGTVKGFDLLTGAHRWTFYLKAQPGDPNRDTWLNGSADTDASPGLWSSFTVDDERGTVFVPVEMVSGAGNNNYWGGNTPGANLYSQSLVALDATTGKIKWFQQLVHHEIWDYDLAAAPTFVEVRRNGQVIPAVAQSTKMGLMFIFHRETGEPIFGMEERPVPQTTVPGEWTSPTQPFPIKPPPLSRNSFTRAEIAKVTPEHQKYCEDLWDSNGLTDTVPYAPWKTDQNTLVFPGAQGGSNWWGAAYNKSLGLMIANTHTIGQWGRLEAVETPAPPGSGQPPRVNYRKVPGPYFRFWNNDTKWACNEIPWGELIAIDANTGDIRWRVTLGAFPELEAIGIKSGTPNSGGAITTAGDLVFIGATLDSYFRAFDARTGEELWRDKLPVPSQGTPSTYMGRDGKQYVVIGANGGGYFGAQVSDEVIAYSLP